MDAREFQQLASELIDGTTRAHFRTAISRAYYATYNVGVEILEEMGFTMPKGPGGHGQVRMHLNNSGDGDLTRVASQLNDLYTRRLHADYELANTEVENQGTARSLVELAGRMIQTLDGPRDETRRTHIITAISDWKNITGGT